MSFAPTASPLKASVVVPVFHNKDSLPQLCEELDLVARDCRKRDINLELVFVDDGSKDESLNTLLQLQRKEHEYAIKVLKLARNFGSIVATRTGIKHISGDCVITLSADLQDPPSLIPQMIDRWIQGNKFVICTRRTRDDPFASKIFSFLFYRFVRNFILNDYPSGGFDLALMDQTILEVLSKSSSQLYTPIQVYSLGFRPEVIFYHRNKRIHGESKWSFSKKIGLFIDIALSFSRKPARMLSLFGLIISLLSAIYGFYIVILALSSGIPVPGFGATMATMAFLFSIVISLLSLILEYLSRIFYVMSSQPEVVIEKIYS